jgi:predicted RNase H-like nuclease (RuvC/YqgF family)
MFSSNDRIQYLEKEMVIFREEALKLYSKLDSMTQENEYLKNRIREIEKEHLLREEHEREQIKSFKIEGMNKSMLENKCEELEVELQRKDEEATRLARKIDTLK